MFKLKKILSLYHKKDINSFNSLKTTKQKMK